MARTLQSYLRLPLTNHLIESLSSANKAALLRACTPQALVHGTTLAGAGDRTRHAHFPTSSCISLVAHRAGTHGVEVGMVGFEGMLGAHLALGAKETPLQALVQETGSALRIAAPDLLRLMGQSPALRAMIGRYLHVGMTQLAGVAICLRFHGMEGRLARWLLMSQDRVRQPSFTVTHEMLGLMLGVRRAGVTDAAIGLQERGLIRYSRGSVTVVDRPGLMAAACSCYAVDRDLYERLMAARPGRVAAGAQATA